jgi:O-Antigen ligase
MVQSISNEAIHPMNNLTPAAALAGKLLPGTCAVLLFVMMFDHTTAPRYICIAILMAALICLSLGAPANRPRSIHLPLWIPLSAWMLWTLMSLAWSVDPQATFHAWLDEIVFPVTAFYAFWIVGRRSPADQRLLQTSLWIACFSLAAMSALCFNYLDPAAPKPGLMHFYARVGHTSTLALMAIPLFAVMAADTRTRWPGFAGILFCVVIGGASLNRFFWVAIAVVAVVLIWPKNERSRVRAFAALGIVIVGTVFAIGIGIRLRNINQNASAQTPQHAASASEGARPTPLVVRVAGTSDAWSAETGPTATSHSLKRKTSFAHSLGGIDRAMHSDTRPMIWGFYLGRARSHPWFGIGFGKPLPALAYGGLITPDLLKIDGNVKTHAHNIFLNTLLQVGIVGLVLELVVFGCLGYQFFRVRHKHPWIYRAGLALLLGMLTKNLTDDFMWQSTMLMFWALSGWLLGRGHRPASSVQPTVPEFRSS